MTLPLVGGGRTQRPGAGVSARRAQLAPDTQTVLDKGKVGVVVVVVVVVALCPSIFYACN